MESNRPADANPGIQYDVVDTVSGADDNGTNRSPVGDDSAGAATPDDYGATAAPKRRGRKPKDPTSSGTPGSSGRQKRATLAVAALAQQIKGAHEIAALFTGQQIVALSEQEAVALAVALQNLAQEYGLAMSGKALAWGQLVGVIVTIYAPRVMVLRAMQAKAEVHL